MTSTRATDLRAILVSQHQRDILRNHHVVGTNARATTGHLAEAFDNAGDQPRIQWCAEHDSRMNQRSCEWVLMRDQSLARDKPCRVVNAIIVVEEARS